MTDSEEVSKAGEIGPTRPLSQKVLTALSLALAPIGLVAGAISASNYVDARDDSKSEIELAAQVLTQEVNDIVFDESLVLKGFALNRLEISSIAGCTSELDRVIELDTIFESAVQATSGGRTVCESSDGDGIDPRDVRRAAQALATNAEATQEVLFDASRENVLFAVRRSPGLSPVIVASAPIESFQASLTALPRPVGSTVAIEVANAGQPPLTRLQTIDSEPGRYGIRAPTQVGGLVVRYDEPLASFPPRRIAAILAPPLMWLAALLIAWLTLRNLVVRPLASMQSGIEERRESGKLTRLTPRVGDTEEFVQFAESYDALARTQRADRERRQDALEEQQRLVREVHHRVKNNLQIVTSLLSIKARDTDIPAEERAYGIIQMRVEALALVHRWLYADDDHRGVDLGALLHDLLAGLEGSIDSVLGVEAMFKTKLEHIFVGQDAAVPLAFLVTEILSGEANQLDDGRLDVSAELADIGNDRGRLTLSGPMLTGYLLSEEGKSRASARIVQGMARQLRADLAFDDATKTFTLEFGIED